MIPFPSSRKRGSGAHGCAGAVPDGCRRRRRGPATSRAGVTLGVVVAVTGVLLSAPASSAAYWETVINTDSFNSYGQLESEWNYLYPWGSDHNGSARMYGSSSDHNHVYVSGGILTLKASRINWDEGVSSSNPHPAIHYHSGAIHAREQVLVNDTYPNYEVRGEFQAPAVRGSWPAFWLTGAWSWPPESDVLEFKGDNRNWFNTFRTSSDVSSSVVAVGSPGSWHSYRIWMTKVSSTNVDIHVGTRRLGLALALALALTLARSLRLP